MKLLTCIDTPVKRCTDCMLGESTPNVSLVTLAVNFLCIEGETSDGRLVFWFDLVVKMFTWLDGQEKKQQQYQLSAFCFYRCGELYNSHGEMLRYES